MVKSSVFVNVDDAPSKFYPFCYTSPLKKVRGIMLYPPKKFAFECPSVRPSVRLSVRQRFVSGLYLEQLKTIFFKLCIGVHIRKEWFGIEDG